MKSKINVFPVKPYGYSVAKDTKSSGAQIQQKIRDCILNKCNIESGGLVYWRKKGTEIKTLYINCEGKSSLLRNDKRTIQAHCDFMLVMVLPHEECVRCAFG